jgi:hypothetical protein
MARPRKLEHTKKRNVGGYYDARLIAAFYYLCDKSGVNPTKGLERLMVEAVKKDRIPGVEPLEINYDELNAQMPFAHSRAKKEPDEESPSSTGTGIQYERPE